MAVGNKANCIGEVSEPITATPNASTLLILPEEQNNWLKGAYRTRKLYAYGGSGAYTWSYVGNLPAGVFLNPATGELYGAPTAEGEYIFRVHASDNASGGPAGDRDYRFMVLETMGGLDFTPTYLPAASVCNIANCYSVPLVPSGGSGTGWQFRIDPRDGLPPGLRREKVGNQWYIKGTPLAVGLGVHAFRIILTDGEGHQAERDYLLPVFTGTAREMLVTPAEAGTAGGRTVRVFHKTPVSPGNQFYYFDFLDATCSSRVESVAPDTIHEYYTDGQNNHYLEMTTPRALEGCGDVRLHNTITGLDKIAPLRFTTLAYASGTVDGTVHLVDTEARTLFTPSAMDQTPSEAAPLGMALNDGAQPGRTLYAAEIASGDLLIFDAANGQYTSTLLLQDKDLPYYGYGATDVAVDSRGYAYVAHTTTGLEAPRHEFPPRPWNPHPGGVSVVDLAGQCLVDADGNDLEGTAGAPTIGGVRYSRIPSHVYPYTISVLKLERAQGGYHDLDGYPGEYAFVSGVGEQPPEPILEICWCRWGNLVIPCDPSASCVCVPPFTKYCIMQWADRPLRIGILDLNPWRVKTVSPWEIEPNPGYWSFLGQRDPGTDGQFLGFSNQGLDFSVASDGLSATVYAVSPKEDRVYTFDFLEAVTNPFSFPYSTIQLACQDEAGNAVVCGPSDVKIQKIGGQNYALIANENAGAVTAIRLSNPPQTQTLLLQGCPASASATHSPKAIDARGDGSLALIADPLVEGDVERGAVTMVALGPPMSMAGTCRISLPSGPDRIVVAPMVDPANLFSKVTLDLANAGQGAYTEPPQQDTLIREWETVHHLQETSADPQAVVVNIVNFQRNMNRWVIDEPLKTELNQSVDLYRAAYVKDHPAAGQ